MRQPRALRHTPHTFRGPVGHRRPQCHRPHASAKAPVPPTARFSQTHFDTSSHVSWPRIGSSTEALVPPPACASHTHFDRHTPHTFRGL
eukprot:2271504-Pyramimonas_sp.AAC.1